MKRCVQFENIILTLNIEIAVYHDTKGSLLNVLRWKLVSHILKIDVFYRLNEYYKVAFGHTGLVISFFV